MRLGSNRIEFAANLGIVALAAVLLALLIKPYIVPEKKNASSQPRPPIAAGTALSIPNLDWGQHEKTLVFALSTHCRFCADSTDFYQRLLTQLASKPNLATLVICPETILEGQKYLADHGLNIPEIKQISLPSLGIWGTPTLLLVDRSGVVIDSWQGKLSPQKEAEVLGEIGSDAPMRNVRAESTSAVIDSTQLTQMMANGEQLTIIDVRDRASYKSSHIPKAKCIPTDELGIRAQDELAPNQQIVLYGDCTECGNDGQTTEIQKSLIELGFPRVTRLKGGIEGWRRAGYTTSTK